MLHFESYEFDCKSLPNSGINMDDAFLQMLNDARGIAGIPFKITSGYRSVSHNKKIGGVQNSSHLIGKACDISVKSGQEYHLYLYP